MRKDAPGHAAGFSLVELSIAMAVLAILAGLALPDLRDMVRRQRVSATLHLLGTQLAQARNTAISHRTPVTVCPSLGDGRCRTEPDWSEGWLVYRDPLRSSQPQAASDVLRDVRQPFHASISVTSSAGRLRVRYQPDGFSSGNNLALKVCAGAILHGEVVVNNAGRARTQRPVGPVPCHPP